MAPAETTRQFSFRLPEGLVHRVEDCLAKARATGLDLTRADIVRLLLRHALDTTQCRIELLLARKGKKRSRKK
jgi:hypothetical protein